MSSSDNIHRQKRVREEWSAQASQELLRLRFRQLRALFDDAQTVADVHEAWGVLAGRLNDDERLQMHVDAVKCSDQLTRLRQQWQESDTAQLHVMMAECFSRSATATSAAPQSEVPQPARNTFNRAMEESMLQESEATMVQVASKRRKTEDVQTEAEEVVEPLLEVQAEAEEEPLSVAEAAEAIEAEVAEVAESVPVSPQVIQNELPTVTEVVDVQQAEDEEFPRQNEIMQALETRSQHLDKLAQSHQELANVTQQLMQALVQRHNMP